MSIKYGQVEKTMDKAMFIILLICGLLILVISVTSYALYKKDIARYIDYSSFNGSGEIIQIGDTEDFTPVITEKGEIIIDGKPHVIDESIDYSFKDHLKVGWTLFNRELLNINNRNDEIFSYNNIIVISSVIFFVYWILLLYKYEKEREAISTTIISDDDLMKKYNPMIAGCIEGNRDVVHTDIASVILGLVNKKIVDLEIVPVNEEEKIYKYIVKRNISNEVNIGMDEIERYVHAWIFGIGISEKKEVNMVERLRYLTEDDEYKDKLKGLRKLVKKKLNSLGANKNKVPSAIRVINTFIFISVILLCLFTVWFGLVNIQIDTMEIVLLYFAIMIFGFSIPIVIFLTYAGIVLFLQTKRIGEILMNKIFKRELLKTIFLIFIMTLTLIIVTLACSISPLIIPFEILLCISFLIMKTDNLMTQNDEEIMMDYNRLKELKRRIAEYSLLNDREIEDVKLWEEYMTYAVAFGVALEVMKDTDKKYEKIKPDRKYFFDLVCNTINAFFDVNYKF